MLPSLLREAKSRNVRFPLAFYGAASILLFLISLRSSLLVFSALAVLCLFEWCMLAAHVLQFVGLRSLASVNRSNDAPDADLFTYGTGRLFPIACLSSGALAILLCLGVLGQAAVAGLMYHAAWDALFASAISLICIVRAFPVCEPHLLVLLQGTPPELTGSLNKAIPQVCALDGVLEIISHHVWALTQGHYVMTIVLRVSNNANIQRITADCVKLFDFVECTVECRRL